MKSLCVIGLLAAFLCLPAQAALPPTPFEASQQQQLPQSGLISGYLRTLADNSPFATLSLLGVSGGGRPIEALLISQDPEFLSNGAPAPQRPTLMLLAGMYGNEPAGVEALQILARRLLDGDLKPLLQKMNLVLVPLANPDGRDLGQRLNARNENPNVDFIAASSMETRLFIDALHRFQPNVVYDLQETGSSLAARDSKQGFVTHGDAQFEVANNPNLDPELRRYAEHTFLPNLLAAAKQAGLPAQRYQGDIHYLEQAVNRGSLGVTNLRNYAGLTGALSVLMESRQGRAAPLNSIKERVRRQLLGLERLLALVAKDGAHIVQLTRRARQGGSPAARSQPVALEVGFGPNSQQPSTEVTLTERASGRKLVRRFSLHDQILIQRQEALPPGYLIRSEQRRFQILLEQHHIRYERITQPRTLEVRRQRLVELKVAAQPKPGVRDWLDLELEEQQVSLTLQPGDLWVPTDQPLGRLAAVMLDPRSSNGIYQEPRWRGLLLRNPLPVALAVRPDSPAVASQPKSPAKSPRK